MKGNIDKLLEGVDIGFDSDSFDAKIYDEVYGCFKGISGAHRKMLSYRNGFYAFKRSLHLFGACQLPEYHSALSWNREDGWRKEYDHLTQGLTFFAENIFGDQYAFSQEGICYLSGESGTREIMASSFDKWVDQVLSDIDGVCGRKVVGIWESVAGRLPDFGWHICGKQPFNLGGEYNTDNMYEMDALSSMRFKGSIAVHLFDVPSGDWVEFVFESEEEPEEDSDS